MSKFLHYNTDILSLFPNARIVERIQPPFVLWADEKDDCFYAIVNQFGQLDQSTTPISEISEEALSRAFVVLECRDEDERFRLISMFRGEVDPGEGGPGTTAGIWPLAPHSSGSDARILGKNYEARDWR